jgi:formylglycine-generating enzyme required for sulfatase activity
MPKYILLVLLFLFGAGYAHAQQRCSCCKLRDAGQAEYNAKRYEEAIRKWQSAKKLSDAAKCNDLDDLIANANKRISERSKPAPKKPAPAKTNPSKKPATTTTQPKTPDKTSAPDRFIKIEGGTFQMGSEEGDSDEKPVHSVTLSSFYMGAYEVTNEEYCQFLNAKGNQTEGGVEWINLSGAYDDEKCRIIKNGSTFSVQTGYERYPVIYVSWYGAKAYCDWLSAKTGLPYRLPTEAEWEYAAGNGAKHTKYSWGNGLPSGKKGGNVADETAKKRYSDWTIFEGYTDGYVYSAPVGSFEPNELGLYDMSGNVWEWCWDWYGAYPTSSQTDPIGADSGSYRVRRGGSWLSVPVNARCAYRGNFTPGFRSDDLGFRLARAAR